MKDLEFEELRKIAGDFKMNKSDKQILESINAKRAKKKAHKQKIVNMMKEAKHGDQVGNVLNKWRSGLSDDKMFVKHVYELVRNGFHDISKDPTGRSNIIKALKELKQDKDWAKAAQSLAGALSLGTQTDEAFYKSRDEQVKEAKGKEFDKSPVEEGFFDECVKKNKDKDNPEAYCASIIDTAKGTTMWRGEDRKEKD
jgi:hypothetical protein